MTLKIFSLSTMKFTSEFLQITCLGTSIYRVQKTKIDSDTIFLASVRPDNCAIGFPNSMNILS
jgi:hypothetical protein